MFLLQLALETGNLLIYSKVSNISESLVKLLHPNNNIFKTNTSKITVLYMLQHEQECVQVPLNLSG